MEEQNQQPITPLNGASIDLATLQTLQAAGLNIAANPQLQALIQQYQPINAGQKKSISHNKFHPDDDERLRSLVQEYGNDWRQISQQMGNRSARQCRDRWKNYLCPDVNNTPWTEEEDKLLDEKYAEYGRKWSQIAKFFPGRTDTNIKNRFTSHKTKMDKFGNENIVQIPSQAVPQAPQPQEQQDQAPAMEPQLIQEPNEAPQQ